MALTDHEEAELARLLKLKSEDAGPPIWVRTADGLNEVRLTGRAAAEWLRKNLNLDGNAGDVVVTDDGVDVVDAAGHHEKTGQPEKTPRRPGAYF